MGEWMVHEEYEIIYYIMANSHKASEFLFLFKNKQNDPTADLIVNTRKCSWLKFISRVVFQLSETHSTV